MHREEIHSLLKHKTAKNKFTEKRRPWCIYSGGGSTESQYLSKNTNKQINIYFSKSRSNTMTTILK